MATKGFNAGKYLTDLNGREYLEVKWRLLWLRTEHPEAVIETELVKHGEGFALFRARVAVPGSGEATGWGSETADDFDDFIEKAETKALGRALAALGYGTQFCEDFDFSAETRRPKGARRPQDGDLPRANENGAAVDARVVDAPVRTHGLKVVRDRHAPGATVAQVKAIYSIARDHPALGEAGVEERCRDRFGCLPADLSKRQASELIDLLRRPGAAAPPDRAALAQPV